MGKYLGVRTRSSTVVVNYATSLATGAASAFSATLETADFDVYKNGSETQRASSNGYTLDEAIDAVTGLSQLLVDMSDNSDAGYWTTDGGYISVSLTPDETLDGVTIAAWLDSWDLETHSQVAQRLFGSFIYPTDSIVATTTNNSTTSINLTEIVDAQTAKLAGEVLMVHDATDDRVFPVRCTAFTYPQATVVGLDGAAMGITVAAGDHVWRVGQFTATNGSLGSLPTSTDIFTGTLTEAYSTDGSTITLSTALYELLALLSEFSVSGTTMTVKKRDGSTTAMTLTLNDATTPTSITRAT